ncbi:MAG: hypothetical protein ABJB01_03015 [Rudaea sp.]
MKSTSFAAATMFAFACLAASAGEILSNRQFIRLGSKTITAGDPTAKALDAGGDPDTHIDAINQYGVKIGEDWTYDAGGRSTLMIRVSSGRVVFVATQLKN